MKNIEAKKKEGGGMEVEAKPVKKNRWDATAPVTESAPATTGSRWDQPTPVRKRNRWDDAGSSSDSGVSDE